MLAIAAPIVSAIAALVQLVVLAAAWAAKKSLESAILAVRLEISERFAALPATLNGTYARKDYVDARLESIEERLKRFEEGG